MDCGFVNVWQAQPNEEIGCVQDCEWSVAECEQAQSMAITDWGREDGGSDLLKPH